MTINSTWHLGGKVLLKLQLLLDWWNSYVKKFRHAGELLRTSKQTLRHAMLHIHLLATRSNDAKRFNLPTTNEIAVILVGDGYENVQTRDIIICKQEGGL